MNGVLASIALSFVIASSHNALPSAPVYESDICTSQMVAKLLQPNPFADAGTGSDGRGHYTKKALLDFARFELATYRARTHCAHLASNPSLDRGIAFIAKARAGGYLIDAGNDASGQSLMRAALSALIWLRDESGGTARTSLDNMITEVRKLQQHPESLNRYAAP